ncbi:ABC-F family ATP-binding cassette domain-containing protein [Candidatus Saccharibacteria bacterium]|nr:ABC-F family ATP-binding cassette domain-containing protein [Candidatus Saccharibacteria bacterium]
MIVAIDIAEKSFGNKILYQDLRIDIQDGEKVGLVGRNGTGKTTLLHMITGEDTDFDGTVQAKKGSIIIGSRQEHHGFEDMTVLEYILGDLPEYAKHKHILDTYPEKMGTNNRMMHEYSDALERFSQLGYFEVEGEILEALKAYQVEEEKAQGQLKNLSGGQKRMVELVKVQRARAHLALIDEPTNHMDFVAKKAFLKWFKSAKEAIIVITHDRDVLQAVDRIIEIRDGQAFSHSGNYDDYLRINAVKISSEVTQFSLVQRRIANLKENIIRFRRLKEKSRDPGTIQRFKSLEEKAATELAELEKTDMPTFWIDRESVGELNEKMGAAYQRHKAKNIKVNAKQSESETSRLLVEVRKLSLGYGQPLFNDIGFDLREGERIRLHGRNGAGKSTLVKAIVAKVHDTPLESTILEGTIACQKELKVGVYEQELDPEYLDLTLAGAIEKAYMAKEVPISDQKVMQLLGDYLFNPATDGDVPLQRLSGGQKARFQLINMLAGDPQILVLDEPTNHLDLPSIEELENALETYHGSVIYISHDSYFARNIGGQTIDIK